MNVRELKEIIKDLPDDMEVKAYCGIWAKYLPVLDVDVKEDDEGEFLGII